jgi:hypothetical protein
MNAMSDFNPQDEWEGMPEFVQEKKREFSKIIVRFDDEESLKEFAKLIGQKLTPKTKSIWHPHKPHRRQNKKVYISEP